MFGDRRNIFPHSALRRGAVACLLFLLATATLPAAEAPVTLKVREPWSNVFGGQDVTVHVAVVSAQAQQATLGWSLAVSGGVVQRAEQAVTLAPDRPAVAELHLRVPATKEGVALPAQLALALRTEGKTEPAATLNKTLWIFCDDPFAYRKERLASLKIRLFDPEKRTAACLEKAGVPFELVANVDAMTGLKDGILIVGEGVSFADYRGLGATMTKVAAGGPPVLCLAPGGGTMELAITPQSDVPEPQRVSLRRRDAIVSVDKRLDAEAWPPDGEIEACSLMISGERGPVVAEARRGGGGWPWLEMTFAGRGKLIVCGFAIVGKWDNSPTPRFLLAGILEELAGKQ